jgi:hypothetical protein
MDEEAIKKKYAKSYKQGLTTTPNPDDLEVVDFDDDSTLRGKDGHLDMDKVRNINRRNEAVVMGWEDQAVKDRLWVGRTVSEGVADGTALYVVIKENKKSVRIRHIKGIGDDYMSRHFGEECTLGKIEALDFMDHGGIFSGGKKVPYPYDIVTK